MTTCLFCNNQKFSDSPFEDTIFNNKRFRYIKCNSCGLVQVDPLPDQNDYEVMYSTGLDYYQFDNIPPSNVYDHIFSKIKLVGEYQTFLDFGCGTGKILVNAIDKGYKATGTDFGNELINKLRGFYPEAAFFEINDFYKTDTKYDVIFVSNIFEHLTNPVEILNHLVGRLNKDGILVSMGPVENNFTIAGAFRRLMFGTRKFLFKKTVSHNPNHIFYSNYTNQLKYFTRSGLNTLRYEILEDAWPFPSSLKEATGFKNKVFWFIGFISIKLHYFIPKSGNHFFYIGKK